MTSVNRSNGDSGLGIVSSRVDGWLVLDASFPEGYGRRTPWDALLATPACPGPAKTVMTPPERRIVLRADIPIEAGIDLAARERAGRESLERLAARHGETPAAEVRPAASALLPPVPPEFSWTSAETRGESSAGSAESGGVVETVMADLAWPFVKRASGRLAVDLRVPGRFCQAFLEPRGTRGCRARVELVALGDADPVVREALAAMLLTLVDAVRFVRAGAETTGDRTSVFLEVDIQPDAAAPELQHALSALSVAGRLAGREASALTDTNVARAYLAARGWAAPFTS